MTEKSVTEQRYDAVLGVISEGRTVMEVASQWGVSRRTRHPTAAPCGRRGMNPIQLAEILGHRSLTMIQQVYAHLSPSDSYAAMQKLLLARDGER